MGFGVRIAAAVSGEFGKKNMALGSKTGCFGRFFPKLHRLII